MKRRWAGFVLTVLVVATGVAVLRAETASAAVPGGSISGRVTVPAGVDVTGVTVEAIRSQPWESVETVSAAPDGTYVLEAGSRAVLPQLRRVGDRHRPGVLEGRPRR
jgi:hypothetical protein